MIKWFGLLWDWIDKRDIDKHALSLGVFYGTVTVTKWAMLFAASHPTRAGVEIAAIIAAVCAPYMALQAAALKYYFESRPTS